MASHQRRAGGGAFALAAAAAPLLLVAFAMMAATPAGANSAVDWQWKTGRATYYGTDAWSIHKGSCGYGAIWRDEPLGWNVAAMADGHPDYAESCGSCYELSCDDAWISDNYGAKMDRSYACFDSSQSVVVRITDTCPCTYAPNEYSNKRWCCSDMDHFDLSVWAWERLADKKWGVIGIRYRRVPCDYQPAKLAPAVSNPSPYPSEPTWGQDKPARDWPEFAGEERARAFIWSGGLQNGWWDSSSGTWTQPWEDAKRSGMRGGAAYCASVHQGGSVSFKTNPGAFVGKYKLEMWVYVGVTGWEGTAARVPDIKVSVRGAKGGCSVLKIYDVRPDAFEPMCTTCSDYYWRFTWYLPFFAGEWTHKTFNSPDAFAGGCGGNGVWDLDEVQVARNDWGADKWVCLDRVALV